MGWLGEVHDIGSLVALLCGVRARWLTGQWPDATGGSIFEEYRSSQLHNRKNTWLKESEFHEVLEW